MSFSRKRIDVEFSMASGSAGGGASKITGHRVIAQIQVVAADYMNMGEFAIYGMPMSQMNQLSVVGRQFNQINKNKIIVSAGEGNGALSKIFEGTIQSAFVDGQAQPQVCFRVSAMGGLYEKAKPIEPTTIKGEANASKLFEDIAKKIDFKFEGSGVDGLKILNPYFAGTGIMQAQSLARALGLLCCLDRDTLAVWKPGQARDGDPVVISRDTGMVGYPAFNSSSVIVTTIFNSRLRIGGKVTIKSDLTPACGDWTIHALNHSLASETPNGPWFSILQTNAFGDTPA